MTTGERIKYYRELLGLTQEEVASRLGTTPQNIYKYEKGIITNIPLRSIEMLSQMFGVSPSILTGWEKEPEIKLTSKEAEVLEAFRKLDDTDKLNVINYINNVLLIAEKYDIKKESFGA